jgi:hypothetical protein
MAQSRNLQVMHGSKKWLSFSCSFFAPMLIANSCWRDSGVAGVADLLFLRLKYARGNLMKKVLIPKTFTFVYSSFPSL